MNSLGRPLDHQVSPLASYSLQAFPNVALILCLGSPHHSPDHPGLLLSEDGSVYPYWTKSSVRPGLGLCLVTVESLTLFTWKPSSEGDSVNAY